MVYIGFVMGGAAGVTCPCLAAFFARSLAKADEKAGSLGASSLCITGGGGGGRC